MFIKMLPNFNKVKCSIILIIILGVFLLISAFGSYLFSQSLMNKKIHENVKLTNGSKAYKFWLDPPASINRKYYFFEILNPNEFLNGAKPKLAQKGPYTYSEKWGKKNVKFLDQENIEYSPISTLFFEPSMSVGNETDVITFLNIPAAAMIDQITSGKIDFFSTSFANSILDHLDTKLIIKRTVKELISGYDDPLVELASNYMPEFIKDERFSLMNGKNGTVWQKFIINTGFSDPLNVGKIASWNGLKKLNYWKSDKANQISGTDGTFYPPYLNRSSVIESFSPDMCRSFGLVYLKDNEIDGVKTFDFHLPSDIFSASELEHAGFCEDKCLGNGVLNISSCYGGVSGFISQPHFLNADEKFIQAIDGVEPNKEIHDFLIHFEPTTGVPVAGNVRVQINFYLEPNEEIDLVRTIQPVLLPVLWFDEEVKLNLEIKKELSQVAFYVRLVTIIPVTMVSTGILLILVSSFVLLKKSRNKSAKIAKKSIYLAESAKLFNDEQIDV